MKASKKDNGLLYAIQCVPKSHFVQNNKNLQILQHPFLNELKYAFQQDDIFYFAYEYVHTQELQLLLHNPQTLIDEHSSKVWAAEILITLKYLLDAGVLFKYSFFMLTH